MVLMSSMRPVANVQPGRASKVSRVLGEDFRRVVLRIDADRDDGDIAANPIAEHLLHARQVRGRPWTRARAAGEGEVDDHLAPLDEVVVEADRPAVVRPQRHVREMLAHPLRARRLLGLHRRRGPSWSGVCVEA